jgi:hypothetical protein
LMIITNKCQSIGKFHHAVKRSVTGEKSFKFEF